jgi:hypothetical protein
MEDYLRQILQPITKGKQTTRKSDVSMLNGLITCFKYTHTLCHVFVKCSDIFSHKVTSAILVLIKNKGCILTIRFLIILLLALLVENHE